MRVDIFVKTVCHKLFLSNGMKGRSEFHGDMGHISLYICSREDIFLLKSVTERNRDLDDMVVLYRKGLDKDILISECRVQDDYDNLNRGRIWEAYLTTKIEEMEEKFGISIPWKNEIRRMAGLKLGRKMVLELVGEGADTVRDIAFRLGLDQADVRIYVRSLEMSGDVVLDRTVRPNKIRPI